jgi:hypothetical protein
MDHATLANPDQFTGRLVSPNPAPKDGLIVVALPGTDYQLHLVADAQPCTEAQGRVRGRVIAQARRIDIVNTGGVFIEPVIGRPRRIQGKVIARDPAANTLTIKAIAPLVCHLDALQKTEQFPIGALVSFDIERGARFEPMK